MGDPALTSVGSNVRLVITQAKTIASKKTEVVTLGKLVKLT